MNMRHIGFKMVHYEVKGVKDFIGMEGHGFNATLYRDGKKVCFIIDDADGGDYHYQWYDLEEPREEIEIIGHDLNKCKFRATKEEAIFLKYLQTLPYELNEFDQKMYPVEDDGFIAGLVERYELAKLCKKKTLFVLKGSDGKNREYEMKTPFTPAVKEHLVKKYGKDLVEILNERILNEKC